MKTSRQFYTELTPEKLSLRKKKTHTKKELSYLKKLLNKQDRILDLACGYGRFTIPLVKLGYNVEGIDITPLLIKKAKQTAKKEKLNIKFILGDMRKLPYKKDTFDKIICIWSAFIELSNKKDQIKATKEMIRVLKEDGFVLLDIPLPKKSTQIYKNKKDGDEFWIKGNVTLGKIGNIEKMPQYIHDKKTLSNLMKECKIKRFKIFKDKFGGRERLFLQFWKK